MYDTKENKFYHLIIIPTLTFLAIYFCRDTPFIQLCTSLTFSALCSNLRKLGKKIVATFYLNFKRYLSFYCRINWFIKYPHTKQKADYYLEPFHENLWICILLSIIFGGLISMLIKKLEENMFEKKERASMVDLAFLGLETFCNQMGYENLNDIKFKIVSITLQITALFMIPAFGAEITSYLTVAVPQIPFNNLDEFIANGEYIMMVREGSFLRYDLEV